MLKTTDTLLSGLVANNQSRWARFYRDYAPWIENALCAKGINPQDAEDIIHETLVELVRIMPTYKYDPERKGSFHSLIFKIAQNKAIEKGCKTDLHRQRRLSIRTDSAGMNRHLYHLSSKMKSGK